MKKYTEEELVERYNRPWAFYIPATIGTWVCFFVAGEFSRVPNPSRTDLTLVTLFLLIGLLFPFLSAWALVWKDSVLRSDLHERIFRFGKCEIKYSILGASVMLGSILLAQAISLLFGYSPKQFLLADSPSFQAGIVSGLLPLFVAPIIEELSWHSYGTDTIRRKMNLFWTSIVFAVYWTFWHAPLGRVEGYYQEQVAADGWIYSLNFVVSLFPFVLLMNWFYYRSNRSIIVPIVFHFSAGFFNEIFQTDPMSKVIQTGLLILLIAYLIAKDSHMFFGRSLVEN